MTHFIDGTWVEGEGAPFESADPMNGEVVWSGREATKAEVGRAVDSCRRAFPGWSRRAIAERYALLERFSDVVRDNSDDLARCISAEMGKPLWEAKQEVGAMSGKAAVTMEAWRARCGPTSIDMGEIRGVTVHRPLGVLGVVGPFNFPGHMPNGHIVPALLAGNTVVFKPSEQTPGVAEATLRLWERAGLPPGIISLVQGGADTGRALAAHPGHDGILFTGGRRAGLALQAALAPHPEKMLALEMGGNNPLIVHRVAQMGVDAAAYCAIQSAFVTAGQRCTGASRLIVPRDVEGETFLTRLAELTRGIVVGHHTARPEPFMGPVIHARAASRLLAAQDRLLAAGATSLVPLRAASPGSALLHPGIIDVSEVVDRDDGELFGPLLRVVRVADFDAAIAEANDTAFGLVAALVSDERELFERFYAASRAGLINWNCPTTGASGRQPFGGTGQSGNHRAAGVRSIEYCVDPVASLQRASLPVPSPLPPGLPPRTEPSEG